MSNPKLCVNAASSPVLSLSVLAYYCLMLTSLFCPQLFHDGTTILVVLHLRGTLPEVPSVRVYSICVHRFRQRKQTANSSPHAALTCGTVAGPAGHCRQVE
jgi:hypothetical protein